MKAASFYTNTSEDREDLAQEIIYQIWKSYKSFKKRSKISTWVYRIAMNTALYHQQSVQKQHHVLQIWARELTKPDETTDLQWNKLLGQIDRLNHLDKSLVFLYLERKSYAEIAEITGISESNVGTRMNRIKQKLKTQIQKNHGTK